MRTFEQQQREFIELALKLIDSKRFPKCELIIVINY